MIGSILYALVCLVLLVWIVYEICDGVLRLTGWTDPQARKAATIAAMTAAVLNSDDSTKKK